MHFYSNIHGRASESYANYKDLNINIATFWKPYGKNIDFSNRDNYPVSLVAYINVTKSDMEKKEAIISGLKNYAKNVGYDDDDIQLIENTIEKIMTNIINS